MVRNKLRRLTEATDAFERAGSRSRPSELEGAFEFETPEDGFIGFRMGFYDIETTALSALMGRVLVVSVCDNWNNVTTRTITDFPQKSAIDDSGLVAWAKDEIERYDILVSWNGIQFDRSLLNARLLYWGKQPIRQDIMEVDMMYRARSGKGGSRIGSSKLDNVAKFFSTSEQKTPLDWGIWQLAAAGDEKALAQIVDHCEADVKTTRQVFGRLKPLVKIVHR